MAMTVQSIVCRVNHECCMLNTKTIVVILCNGSYANKGVHKSIHVDHLDNSCMHDLYVLI